MQGLACALLGLASAVCAWPAAFRLRRSAGVPQSVPPALVCLVFLVVFVANTDVAARAMHASIAAAVAASGAPRPQPAPLFAKCGVTLLYTTFMAAMPVRSRHMGLISA